MFLISKQNKKALQVLKAFTNSELAERAFSSNAFKKSEYRNKLNASPDECVSISTSELVIRCKSADCN